MLKSKVHPKKEKIIELKNVHKDYHLGDEFVRAVDGINIMIHKGDFIAIVGPSGSGKSTTMNLVGALDFASQGDIYLDNVNIEKLEESELAQIRGRKIGFIFQTFNLIPTLTALENVMLPMVFQRIEFEEREIKARELLEKIGLGHRLNHLPNELSGGERQRVAIARALANDPEVILADEPTGNLDSKRGEEIAKMLDKLNSEGRTIILVTHDMHVAKHARKIFQLKDGKIVKGN
jgi:putative ABC transport system ATP-binding protein